MKRLPYDAISLRNGRRTNMDSLLVRERTIAGQPVRLAVVCDGVGSLVHGAYAAAAAVEKMGRWFGELASLERLGLRLRDAVLAADQQIASEACAQGLRTAATFSAILLSQGRYYLAHVGDSRVYSWDGCALRQLTVDERTEDGRLTACIGCGRAASPQYGEGTATGMWFLLCTDGLYKRMDAEYLCKGLKQLRERKPGDILRGWAQYVISCGEQDNISAVLLGDGGRRRI